MIGQFSSGLRVRTAKLILRVSRKDLDNKDTPRINLFKVMLRPVLKCPYFLGMLITVASYQLSIRISTEISKSFCVTKSRIILFNFPYCTPHSQRSFKCQR